MQITLQALLIELQELPNQVLSPNFAHRYGNSKFMLASAKKRARRLLAEISEPARQVIPASATVALQVGFAAKTDRRDLDNLNASLKPHLDGLADGLRINDKKITSINSCKVSSLTDKTTIKITWNNTPKA